MVNRENDNVFILSGCNLGDRENSMRKAKELISNLHASRIIQTSQIYETKAWGIEDQPSFLNQVIQITTSITPENLLKELLSIEKTMGRVRDGSTWGPRIMDLDILYYGNHIIDKHHLKIPHPHIQKRRFTLVPLNEIAGSFLHPLLNRTQRELLQLCEDPLEVNAWNE